MNWCCYFWLDKFGFNSCSISNRSNVFNEPFLWRSVSHIWHWRAELSRVGPGGSDWPDDLRLSEDDQVHFLQIRCQWRGRKAWRRLHFAAQCCQRKNLRFSLVLVPLSWHSKRDNRHIQGKKLVFKNFFFEIKPFRKCKKIHIKLN